MDLDGIVAAACGELATLPYTRGKKEGVQLGQGRNEALLRAVLLAYARWCDADPKRRLHAPRLILTARALAVFGQETAPGLTIQMAANALYEWSWLLKAPALIDVDDGSGGIARVTVRLHHKAKSESFDLALSIDQDTTGKHNYTPILRSGTARVQLNIVVPPAPAGKLAPASTPPDDRAVILRFFREILDAIASRFPERLQKARQRIETARTAKESRFVTALAVLAILLAGGWVVYLRIHAAHVADTTVNVRTGAITKEFNLQYDGTRARLVDPKTHEPLSPWANAITDPETGDRIEFMGRAADGRFQWRITSGTLPSVDRSATLVQLPTWWYFPEDSPYRDMPYPGLYIAALPTEKNRALIMMIPEYRNSAEADAVEHGRVTIEIDEHTRFTNLPYSRLDGRWPMLLFTVTLADDNLHQLNTYWTSPEGKVVFEEYCLVCGGKSSADGVHLAEEVNLRLNKPRRFASWPTCDYKMVFFHNGNLWSRVTAQTIDDAYKEHPNSPLVYVPPARHGVVPMLAMTQKELERDLGPP